MKTGAVAGMAGGIRRKCSETVVRKDRKGAEKMGGCSNPGVSSPVLALGNLGAAASVWPSPGQGLCATGPQIDLSRPPNHRDGLRIGGVIRMDENVGMRILCMFYSDSGGAHTTHTTHPSNGEGSLEAHIGGCSSSADARRRASYQGTLC